jgi:hypothetical protein
MAQSQYVWRGKTWKLKRALDLKEKENLTPAEVEDLVQGCGLCTEQSVKILASGRDTSENVKIIGALLSTSGSLLDKAMAQLDRFDPAALTPGKSADLEGKIEKIKQDSFFVSHWYDRMASDFQPGFYNA